jgi:hypothetical protein
MSMVQYGYEDPNTGRIEKLELSTDMYDAKKEAIRRYKAGEKVFAWHYSVGSGSWGKPEEWHPEKDHKGGGLPKKENQRRERGNTQAARGIKELSAAEKDSLTADILSGMSNSDIILKYGVKRVNLHQYTFYLKNKGGASRDNKKKLEDKKNRKAPKKQSLTGQAGAFRSQGNPQGNHQGIAELAVRISEKILELLALKNEINELLKSLQEKVMGGEC